MNSSLSPQQSLMIDYAKGLGMLLVVIGHYSWAPDQVYSVYLFHMPLFFILGGLVMKPSKNHRRWVRTVAKDYALYFIIWYVLIALATLGLKSLFEMKVSLYLGQGSDLLYFPLRFNMHNNSLFMIGWFIISYAFAANMFKALLTFIPRLNALHLLLLGLVVGYCGITLVAPAFHAVEGWGKSSWYWNILCQIMLGFMFISIGYALKPYLAKLGKFYLLAICSLLLFSLAGSGIFHPIGMSWSDYPDGFWLHIASSMLGSVALLSLAYFISLAPPQKGLRSIGQHSKDIMTMHLLGLVLADLMVAKLTQMPTTEIGELSHFMAPEYWSVYLTMGIIAPIAVRKLITASQTQLLFLTRRLRNYLR